MHNCPNCGIALRKFESVTVGDVVIDRNSDIYYLGQRVEMHTQVRLIAEALIRGDGRVYTRSVLLDILDVDDPRTIDVYVRRARLAFQRINPEFDQFTCVRRVGYRFDRTNVQDIRLAA